MNLDLTTVSTERIEELQTICTLVYLKIAKQSKDVYYLDVLQELCKFASSIEEVAIISLCTGKFLLK